MSSLLPPEGASLSQPGLSSGGLAKDGSTGAADDNGLSVGEDGGDVEASGALDVHEEGSWSWDKSLRKNQISIVSNA